LIARMTIATIAIRASLDASRRNWERKVDGTTLCRRVSLRVSAGFTIDTECPRLLSLAVFNEPLKTSRSPRARGRVNKLTRDRAIAEERQLRSVKLPRFTVPLVKRKISRASRRAKRRGEIYGGRSIPPSRVTTPPTSGDNGGILDAIFINSGRPARVGLLS